ncbi:MAG: SPOR domain-containing protein, partial [Prevotellaceae bacterium]|nr:SPOR domain-containing protein [Prevotellaceae bacterium]
MIQNKLKSLVLSNRRLIIPTIGAFLVNQQGVVTFSSFLKYDDGLLAKLLCEQEHISEEDAQQIIRGFAHEVLDTITIGNKFQIANFGYFSTDNHGNVMFTVENAVAEPINPYIPPVVETQPVVTTPEEPQNFFNTPFTEPPIFNTTGQNNDFGYQNDNNVNSHNTMEKEKKSKAGYWILTIILIIIAVLLLLYLFSKDFKKTVNSLFSDKPRIETVKDTTPPVADTATVVQDTATVVTQQQPEHTQTYGNIAASTLNGKYQVVAGCYLEREIADKFVRELKEKGYEPRIPDHLSGEWIVVIVYESDDENDAARVRDQFAAAGYDDAYIRKRSGGIV